MRVEVVPYDPTWPEAFATIESELQGLLAGADVVGIEHVGSTAVPGLAAKPVIDIDIVVATEGHVDAAANALADGGYRPLGDLGIPGRYAFAPPHRGHRRNVYVTVDGCLSLRNHLAVRQVLRNDPELRERYGDLKLRLATNDYDGIDGYVEDKTPVLQEILVAAGLPPAERDTIAGVNRTDRRGRG